MSDSLRCVPPSAIVAGWDFSTGSVKCLAFDTSGEVVAEARFPTDLWTAEGVSELSPMLLEGQARATVRAIAHRLRDLGRLSDWIGGGISATHHTAGRIDADRNPIRRLICWNDQTLADYHAVGLRRLGGPAAVRERIGGPWAVRYSLSHLVKDEATLTPQQWADTVRILPHGPLAAGYLTGNYDVISVSSAASTGMMDLRTDSWSRAMLGALSSEAYRHLAWDDLPRIIGMNEPVGPLSESMALEGGLPPGVRPLIFPTLDDQAAGLLGGGAVESGQMAIVLGNSAVVNSSSSAAPLTDSLDAMKLNWGPWLWMRCYSNGAQFLDTIVGSNPDFAALEAAARRVPPGCNGVRISPFVLSEPSVGVLAPRPGWFGAEPTDPGVRFRACLEALSYLIALGVNEHAAAGQKISRISISGGIARSPLMGEILASVLNRPLERLRSSEGTALGAAVVALTGLENHRRVRAGIAESMTVSEASALLVQYTDPIAPRAEWIVPYTAELARFSKLLAG